MLSPSVLPPKVLLLYTHPEPLNSVANKVLLQPVHELEHVTIHDLYGCYPDFFIDVAWEQKLLREHKIIVFQHPLYTYSCPALLKEWMDRVLSRDFVSGAEHALRGKYWRSVITTGEPQGAYQRGGYNLYPLEEILRPFELTALMCQMHWLSPMIVYSARRQRPEALVSHADAYREWLKAPLSLGGL
ncbi:glutathione-regulated potassium-efflux system ancillary protein KefG [Xenorhabdus sp. PB62.4]|uniref:glutathione-regulated potassium-efflux system ancillary protein KefG n=1 Tax=Xenorhabdus sp. PB62.4 TaxID=1851573 RepID=UPI0016571218|nr:glutathione-regulated potassium-efflux system ancillary protein KefG [Xenorhabdus sp. PB62.4]MBC8953884.1 glutathione-regulated potassium-efflux system ancillary protein KefG [Xenorhabdus sp. PB62.4]